MMSESQNKATSALIAQSVSGQASVESSDFANEALVDALRWCFGLLKLAMIVAVLFYALSGFFQVKENERALKVRFGKVVGMDQPNGPALGPGFHAAYPWPIDRIIRVSVDTERSVSSEFVYQMTDQQRLAPDKMPTSESLVPGKDHYVLTGDANILHVTMTVRYHVSHADTYGRRVELADAEVQPGFESQPERELMTVLADSAVVQAAAEFSVDNLLIHSKDVFGRRVEQHLKAALARANCGLEVREGGVLINTIEVPRQVVAQFNEVRNAAEEGAGSVKKAEGERVKVLTETAGPGYQQLVDAIRRERELLLQKSPEYAASRDEVSKLIAGAGGSVRGILTDAMAYRNQVRESAKADAAYFSALLPKYQENPKVVLTRLLLGMYEDLFDKTRKYYVSKDAKEIRLMIDRDPVEMQKDRVAAEAAKTEAMMRGR